MPRTNWRGIRRDDPDRETLFWMRVDRSAGPDACWPYIAGRSGNGYGHLIWDGRSTTAHRVALMVSGSQPEPGQIALHACDNKPCCNPSHLRWGTPRENILEAFARGLRGPSRPVYGEKTSASRLTREQVEMIRALYPKFTQVQISNAFGITQPAVSYIVNNINWPKEKIA